MRSRLPGYLLAAGAALAIGGFISWKVVGQANAIHRAELATPAEERAEGAPGNANAPLSSVLVMLPPDPSNPVSRTTTTTGALAPAPIATAATNAARPRSSPASATAVASLPISPLPPVTGTAVVPAEPAPHRARVARPNRATNATDDNPFDDGSETTHPKAKPSAPATSDDVFTPRE